MLIDVWSDKKEVVFRCQLASRVATVCCEIDLREQEKALTLMHIENLGRPFGGIAQEFIPPLSGPG